MLNYSDYSQNNSRIVTAIKIPKIFCKSISKQQLSNSGKVIAKTTYPFLKQTFEWHQPLATYTAYNNSYTFKIKI